MKWWFMHAAMWIVVVALAVGSAFLLVALVPNPWVRLPLHALVGAALGVASTLVSDAIDRRRYPPVTVTFNMAPYTGRIVAGPYRGSRERHFPEQHGITPLRGYRSWAVDPDDLTLQSPQRETSWDGGVHTATCTPPDRAMIAMWAAAGIPTPDDVIRHDAPHQPCSCGIYAYKSANSLAWNQWTGDPWRLAMQVIGSASHADGLGPVPSPPEPQVFGEVDLWGKVIEAERGYRAEHARIVSIFDTGELAAQVAEKLDVPLVAATGLPIEGTYEKRLSDHGERVKQWRDQRLAAYAQRLDESIARAERR